LSKIKLVFSDVFPEIRATFVSSVATNTHSVAYTLAFTTGSSGAMVRAEKIVSV
jgi:hypothetical protein